MSDDSSTRSIRTNSNSHDTKSNNLDIRNYSNSSVAATTPSTTVLFAPQDFVRPRSVTDFNASYQAAQTVQSIHKPLPRIPDARDVNPVIATTTLAGSHKHCSVPPGFQCSDPAFDSASHLARRRAADMVFSDSDTSDSFGDSDTGESCDDGPCSQPHTSAVVPKVAEPSCRTGDGTAVSSAQRIIPVDMTQSDSEVPDSWFDRDDASSVPDVAKPPTACSKSRKESLVNIKNIVSDWLKPNESLPSRTDVTQPITLVDMAAPRRHSQPGSWADIVTNQTPGTSPAGTTDWPSITEALAMPNEKTAPLVAHVSRENEVKKLSPFPAEDQREGKAAEVVRLPFGMNQKRVCTVCGSADHLIYDCPRGSHSILFD